MVPPRSLSLLGDTAQHLGGIRVLAGGGLGNRWRVGAALGAGRGVGEVGTVLLLAGILCTWWVRKSWAFPGALR